MRTACPYKICMGGQPILPFQVNKNLPETASRAGETLPGPVLSFQHLFQILPRVAVLAGGCLLRGAGADDSAAAVAACGTKVDEQKAQNYLALIHFACAIIVWRKPIPVHR